MVSVSLLRGAFVGHAAAWQGIAVDGHKLVCQIRAEERKGSGDALGEGNRIHRGEDAQDGFSAGNAVMQIDPFGLKFK